MSRLVIGFQGLQGPGAVSLLKPVELSLQVRACMVCDYSGLLTATHILEEAEHKHGFWCPERKEFPLSNPFPASFSALVS
jgi:hypothetical protein